MPKAKKKRAARTKQAKKPTWKRVKRVKADTYQVVIGNPWHQHQWSPSHPDCPLPDNPAGKKPENRFVRHLKSALIRLWASVSKQFS